MTFIPLVSAITLNAGSILNASGSNSTIIITNYFNVDRIAVFNSNVTLNNVSCPNGTLISYFCYDIPNSHIEDTNFSFCGIVISVTPATGTAITNGVLTALMGFLGISILFVAMMIIRYLVMHIRELPLGSILGLLVLLFIIGIIMLLLTPILIRNVSDYIT